jgi:hypothetical protein
MKQKKKKQDKIKKRRKERKNFSFSPERKITKNRFLKKIEIFSKSVKFHFFNLVFGSKIFFVCVREFK